jgi:hypothetical protein
MPDEIEELAHDVLIHGHGGASFAAYLLSHCNDDRSIARVMLRLREVLSAEQFTKAPGGRERYTLTARRSLSKFPHDVHHDVFSTMRHAAFDVVDVKLIRWRPDASRHSPIAERESIERVLQAVLESVDSPVELTDLSDVVADRFNVTPAPHIMSWNSDYNLVEPTDRSDVEDSGLYGPEALFVWSQLDFEEQLLLPLLGESVRVAAEALGWRRTKTHSVMQRTAAVLARALGIENPETLSSTGTDLGENARVFDKLVELSVSKWGHRQRGSI